MKYTNRNKEMQDHRGNGLRLGSLHHGEYSAGGRKGLAELFGALGEEPIGGSS